MNKYIYVLVLLAASLLGTPIASATQMSCTPDQTHAGDCDGLRGQIAVGHGMADRHRLAS